MEADPVSGSPTRKLALTKEQVREILRRVALFQGLGGDDLEEILGIAEPVLVESDEMVFEEGERGDHFFIIVKGQVELRKGPGPSVKKLAVLGAGQAFGEMALLNQTPRSASAVAREDTYMLSVSRASFSELLGGETLAVRLLRNLSKALWATSVRLAAKEAAYEEEDSSQRALGDFNRLLRARLLPRVTPRVRGYDLAAATSTPRAGVGSALWDWFVIADGRPVFTVSRASDEDVFAAQRLVALRTQLRALAGEWRGPLGGLLTKATRNVRAGWIEGLSGPVECGLVALSDGAAEYVGTAGVLAAVVRPRGDALDLWQDAPAVGARPDHEYQSGRAELDTHDRVAILSVRPPDGVRLVTSVLTKGYASSSKGALTGLFDRLAVGQDGKTPRTDLTGVVIARSP